MFFLDLFVISFTKVKLSDLFGFSRILQRNEF